MLFKRCLMLGGLVWLGSQFGCQSEPGIELRGTILLDERPLSGAQVKLLPRDPKLQTLHVASSDLQGVFVLKDADARNKIVPGKYVVLVSKVTGGMGSATNEVPELYNDINTSPLRIEVTASQMELPSFKLKSRP